MYSKTNIFYENGYTTVRVAHDYCMLIKDGVKVQIDIRTMINVILPILQKHPYMSTEHIADREDGNKPYCVQSKVIYRKPDTEYDTIAITDKDGQVYELPLKLYREIAKID